MLTLTSGWSRLAVAILGIGLNGPVASGVAADQTPGSVESASDAVASQVTVEVRHDQTQSRFRGTVTHRAGNVLTVLTAAHCVAPGDQGYPAKITVGGVMLRGEVASVVWNPAFRPKASRDLHGPDVAVARFRVAGDNKDVEEILRRIRPAVGPVEFAFPDPGGRTVVVRVIDAKGQEYVLRAGNHMNPRWLEWGPGYFPQPGDSGGGVFWLRPATEAGGRPTAVLIGTIVGHDARGGGAALVSIDQPWLNRALNPPPEPAPVAPVPVR